jgi:ferrous iron transport protein B
VGNPNVGKSVLFGALTGAYVTVSNYPGTTVEVTRGLLRGTDMNRPVVDLPGIYSLVPHSDDERVTLDALLEGAATGATVVLVADTKNLERGLLLAFELADAGVPFVVSLNMVDEAERRGIFCRYRTAGRDARRARHTHSGHLGEGAARACRIPRAGKA